MEGSSGTQWSFSNTTNSQLLSFKSAQERERGGTTSQNHSFLSRSFSQRNLAVEKQGSSHYPFSAWQNKDNLSVNHSSESRIFPLASIKTTQIATPASVIPPSTSPVVGSTDLRNSANISTGPCQLTIFYNGSVCVYDNVSPDKAQAIMLLAGNGDSNSVPSAPKTQPATPKPQPHQAPLSNPSLGFSSSVSLARPVGSLPIVATVSSTQVNPVKPAVVNAHIRSPELSKSSPAHPNFIPSAVPQARKASLARFSEKRKERVIGASPYRVSKNASECSAAGPGGPTFAANSASSSPVPLGN